MKRENFYFWDWNLVTGSIVISKNWLNTLGAESEGFALSGSWFRSRIHPDDLPMILVQIEQHLSGVDEVKPFCFRLKASEASYLNFVSKGFVVLQDEDGRPGQLIWASELHEQAQAG
jgi:two-component system sensor histidine kinase/response regulator